MNDQTEQSSVQSRTIRDMGVLDLRYAKSPDDLQEIDAIHDVGVVLISEDAAAAFGRILLHDVGSVVTLPSNVPVNCMTGQLTITGETLKNGDPDTVLVLVGQTTIVGEITSIGFKEIRGVGQLVVPRAGQSVFSAKLANMTGQLLYVPDNCRIILGVEDIDNEFLDFIQQPTAFVVMGVLTFAPDIDRDKLQAKVTEIVLLGVIKVPKHAASFVNFIAKEKMGAIEVTE